MLFILLYEIYTVSVYEILIFLSTNSLNTIDGSMSSFQHFHPLRNLQIKFEADENTKELPIFINQTGLEGKLQLNVSYLLLPLNNAIISL